MARPTALEVYKLLPHTNCGECEESSCMGYALKIISRERKLGDCPYHTKENLKKLTELTTPPVRPVELGVKNKRMLGGEEVAYRHELRFFNPTVVAIDVSDVMTSEECERRISFLKNFELERVGEKIRLDAVAIRCATGDAKKFGETVKSVSERYDGPYILCSYDPNVIEEGLKVVGGDRPLVYAATEENWKKMEELAGKYDAAIAIQSEDIAVLGTLSANMDYDKLVLDPGLAPSGGGLRETLDRFVMLRRSAVKGVRELGYPLMCAPAFVWNGGAGDVVSAFYESFLSSMLVNRYASLLVVHSTEPWSIMPALTLRQNVYTDPRTEPTVKPGLYVFGKPDESSPVFITTNFSLTYFTVEGDLKKSKVDGYLLVADTKGLAVDTAVATGDLNAAKIKKALEEHNVGGKVKHRTLILPLFAGQIRGAIEDETGWKVLVGPRDSSQIHDFLDKFWRGKDG